jgi:catecholate siderophore receptor
MKFVSVAQLALALGCWSTDPATADDATRDALYAAISDRVYVDGERKRNGLMTSTATKIETPLVDIPQSLSIISEQLIEELGMRSMGDVVRYTPGVTIGQGEGNRDQATFRGNSSTADFYVDGVRDDLQYFRDLYNAERIEVLRGPNALIFGRGGGGGVINRVTETAGWEPAREIELEGGSFGFGRGAIDAGAILSESAALRLNAVYENSDSYRNYVGIERWGVNPTASFTAGEETLVQLSYEYFSDERTADRGVPSQDGLPFAGSAGAFFGNPDQSHADVSAHLAAATITHQLSDAFKFRNRTIFADYGKFYENVHANSAVGAAGDVALQAYFSGTDRKNVFNQTDFTLAFETGALTHAFLFGFEFGSQGSQNFRAPNNNAAGVVNVSDPAIFTAVVFNPIGTRNDVDLKLAAVYAQDQITFGPFIAIGGARFDRFDLDFDDVTATDADFARTDEVVSPRAGLIFKPIDPISLYGNFAVSFLPQSGDQFGSLNVTTAALEPERFESLEAGVKWDIAPDLTFTAAVYRLDRTNTRAIDPMTNLTVLTGSQRSKGVELGLTGRIVDGWSILAGYALQDAEITQDTAAAPAGRSLPLVPRHSVSIWNRFDPTEFFGLGVGVIHQSDVFTSISNAVVLPSFTRVDAAVYLKLTDKLDTQLNVENVFNETYWSSANNDNNITPGSPRAFRAAIRARL